MKNSFLFALRRSVPVMVGYFPVGIAYGILMAKLGYNFLWSAISSLVVYCLRTTSFTTPGGFLPQAIAVAVTAGLHLWKRNTLISVLAGTAVYMCLVQFVFA